MTPLLCNKFIWLELCAGSVHAITIILSLCVHLALFQEEKKCFLKITSANEIIPKFNSPSGNLRQGQIKATSFDKITQEWCLS